MVNPLLSIAQSPYLLTMCLLNNVFYLSVFKYRTDASLLYENINLLIISKTAWEIKKIKTEVTVWYRALIPVLLCTISTPRVPYSPTAISVLGTYDIHYNIYPMWSEARQVPLLAQGQIIETTIAERWEKKHDMYLKPESSLNRHERQWLLQRVWL